MANLYSQLGFPELQFFDDNGKPLAGGSVYTYDADGVTPKVTLDGPNGSPNTNPVILDPAGRGTFWGLGTYVFGVFDSLGNQIYTNDTASPNAELGISAAMLPVIRADTTAEALSLLGGVSAAAAGVVPIGGVVIWSTSTVPAGWLACNGSAVSRATYISLFALIGVLYGPGDGVSTFNLPDLRSRVPVGYDNVGGTPTNRITTAVSGLNTATLGAIGGDQSLSSHSHTISDPGHVHTTASSFAVAIGLSTPTGEGFAPNPPDGLTLQFNMPVQSATTGITVNNDGGGVAANIPPTIVMQYIIFVGV